VEKSRNIDPQPMGMRTYCSPRTRYVTGTPLIAEPVLSDQSFFPESPAYAANSPFPGLGTRGYRAVDSGATVHDDRFLDAPPRRLGRGIPRKQPPTIAAPHSLATRAAERPEGNLEAPAATRAQQRPRSGIEYVVVAVSGSCHSYVPHAATDREVASTMMSATSLAKIACPKALQADGNLKAFLPQVINVAPARHSTGDPGGEILIPQAAEGFPLYP